MPVKVSTNEKMDAVYDVLIDTMGTFSYILCRIFDKDLPSEGKYIVRGTSQVHFHCEYILYCALATLIFVVKNVVHVGATHNLPR